MGWLSGYHNKKDLIKHLTEDRKHSDNGITVEGKTLTYCVRGICLWQVLRITKTDQYGVQTEKKYITLDLIKKFGENDYGYKDMDESANPFYYSCPLKYLKMVPEVMCQEWRDKVIAYHANLNFKFVPGMIMEINGKYDKFVEVINKETVKTRDGRLFKFPRKLWTGKVFNNWNEATL